ncbi:MAG: GNAT family N-acetyltransferase [Fimbriimonadaceae bacterium]|nr:GNAT family N-acetyltransferase [Fimbriimonadaceae bacterium]
MPESSKAGNPRMRTIHTERLTLIPQTEHHAVEMFRVLSDPRIYEFENQPPESEEHLRQRFQRLETRQSPDGKEAWLNWVIQRSEGELIGYVQATVLSDHRAFIAYELNSAFWRQGYGSETVRTLLVELESQYFVRQVMAVFKKVNYRSRGLLLHLGFTSPNPKDLQRAEPDEDEDLLLTPLPIDKVQENQ